MLRPMNEPTSSPVLLAQISDLHIGGKEDGKDPLSRLEAVIEAIRALPNRLDGVGPRSSTDRAPVS